MKEVKNYESEKYNENQTNRTDIPPITNTDPIIECIDKPNNLHILEHKLSKYPKLYSTPLLQPSPPLEKKSSSILKPGSLFTGYQESGKQRYNVEVKLTEVDLNSSHISGFLTIHNLTESNPLIVTFFKGEIIGKHYTFETKHSKWGSNFRNDIQHWARFPSWRSLDLDLLSNSNNDRIISFYNNLALQNENLFMRWKELFLYPDAYVTDIKGASFAGFYYVSFNQLSGSITGLYFHRTSDKFQQLNLSFVPDSGISACYEYS